MKKILLHDQQYSIGGPKAVLDGIVHSYLGERYNFVRVYQTEACGFNPIKAVRFVGKYRKVINIEHADAIYICGLQYIGFLMTLAAKLSNVKKVILSVHGSEWDNPNNSLRKWLLMHVVEPLEIRMADSVITVCEAAQKTIKPLSGRKNNDGVVYNTFPSTNYHQIADRKLRKELGIPNNKIVVTSVGRVVEAKGHREIIEAIKSINDSSFVFVIVGEGPYLIKYKELCPKEIAEGKVFLLGRRNDVNEILKDSDIFLFATHNENHSIALLEAVNMHCAALVTQVGGNPEIIQDGYSGLWIPPYDSSAIVHGLKKMKEDELRKKYTQNAYKYCSDKFSVVHTYGVLDKLFNN